MLTSRAEYRLILRHDNADLRLREYAHEVGSITDTQYQNYKEKKEKISKCIELFDSIKIKLTGESKQVFIKNNIVIPTRSESLKCLIKRPEINIDILKELADIPYEDEILEEVEIMLKYEGYINKTYKEVEKMKKLESKQIPKDIDYSKVKNLASEARQKLEKVRPISLGQATRISGVNPVDITILSIYLKKEYNNE